MESSVVVAIISVVGAGLIAGLGYFMKHLVDGIGAKIDRLEARVDRLEEGLNDLRVVVAKIAATQQDHSAKLQHMMDHMMSHGERISALEVATFGAGAKTPTSA